MQMLSFHISQHFSLTTVSPSHSYALIYFLSADQSLRFPVGANYKTKQPGNTCMQMPYSSVDVDDRILNNYNNGW